jgi:hypothetical protein
MSHSHCTLAFPLSPGTDTAALSDQLAASMPKLLPVLDAIGTVHASRFTVLDARTLLFLADFDGGFGELIAGLGKDAGPVFDLILAHVEQPPPVPVSDHLDAFVDWTARHLLHAATLFSAYPDVTVADIKAMAAAAGVASRVAQLPFLVILPIKSALAYTEVHMLLLARAHRTQKDLAMVGTPHFAQFVPLGGQRIGFFTVYDGSFETYIDDFTKYIGPVFDLVFKFVQDPPPSPCRRHVQEFVDFAASANRAPIGFYQACPGLTVQDIHALIADRQAAPA